MMCLYFWSKGCSFVSRFEKTSVQTDSHNCQSGQMKQEQAFLCLGSTNSDLLYVDVYAEKTVKHTMKLPGHTHMYRALSVKVKGVTEGFKSFCITSPHDLWACNLNSRQKSKGLFTWGLKQRHISLLLHTVNGFRRVTAMIPCWRF